LRWLALAAILVAGTTAAPMPTAFADRAPAETNVVVHAPLIRQAVNVCTSNGCAPVQTKRVRHRPRQGGTAHHI
jgi:hypothetical protein